jgi:hypothetical protein
MTPRTEQIVTLVSRTPCGCAYLPAQVVSVVASQVTLRVFYDNAGGSEILVSVPYGANGEPDTWHYGTPEETHFLRCLPL